MTHDHTGQSAAPPNPPGPTRSGPAPVNVSAIALTVVGVVTVSIVALGFGILALMKNSTDPAGSRRLTKIGWIVWAILFVALVGTIIALVRSGTVTM